MLNIKKLQMSIGEIEKKIKNNSIFFSDISKCRELNTTEKSDIIYSLIENLSIDNLLINDLPIPSLFFDKKTATNTKC